jgi:hypothetical protein
VGGGADEPQLATARLIEEVAERAPNTQHLLAFARSASADRHHSLIASC